MSDRSRRDASARDPLAGTWAEDFLSPSEARVFRRRFGIAGDTPDDEELAFSVPVPIDGGSDGGSSAPAAPPMPPARRDDDRASVAIAEGVVGDVVRSRS